MQLVLIKEGLDRLDEHAAGGERGSDLMCNDTYHVLIFLRVDGLALHVSNDLLIRNVFGNTLEVDCNHFLVLEFDPLHIDLIEVRLFSPCFLVVLPNVAWLDLEDLSLAPQVSLRC